MASEFIGYTVLVTLKSPPNCQAQGVVADVVGQRLTLQDGQFYPQMLCQGELLLTTW